jgi:hypothetical protein
MNSSRRASDHNGMREEDDLQLACPEYVDRTLSRVRDRSEMARRVSKEDGGGVAPMSSLVGTQRRL